MRRLTRQESREQTRQRLLDAAATVIANKGLATTTVEDIVERAGYTRGAFYSNFNSRIELFVELLKSNHAGIKNSLRHLLDTSLRNEDLEHAPALRHGKCDHDDTPLLLWIEARHHAIRDPQFRHLLNALTLELRDVMVHFIDDACRRMNITPSIAPNALAPALLALIEGSLCFRMTMSAELSGTSLRAALNYALMYSTPRA